MINLSDLLLQVLINAPSDIIFVLRQARFSMIDALIEVILQAIVRGSKQPGKMHVRELWSVVGKNQALTASLLRNKIHAKGVYVVVGR